MKQNQTKSRDTQQAGPIFSVADLQTIEEYITGQGAGTQIPYKRLVNNLRSSLGETKKAKQTIIRLLGVLSHRGYVFSYQKNRLFIIYIPNGGVAQVAREGTAEAIPGETAEATREETAEAAGKKEKKIKYPRPSQERLLQLIGIYDGHQRNMAAAMSTVDLTVPFNMVGQWITQDPVARVAAEEARKAGRGRRYGNHRNNNGNAPQGSNGFPSKPPSQGRFILLMLKHGADPDLIARDYESDVPGMTASVVAQWIQNVPNLSRLNERILNENFFPIIKET